MDFRFWDNTGKGKDGASHGLDHINGGNDQIDGDRLHITENFTNFSANVGGAASDADDLTAHLRGIDALLTGALTGGVYMWTYTSVSTTGNVAFAGAGFQPKLVLFSGALNTATTGTNHGFGAASASGLSEWTISTAVAATNNARYRSNSACIAVISAGTGSPVKLASFVSFDSDGFTINFSTNDSNVWGMYAIGIG